MTAWVVQTYKQPLELTDVPKIVPGRSRRARRDPHHCSYAHRHGDPVRLDLPGKTVAITGAGAGLGATLARALRAHGANVALLDLTADGIHAARRGGKRYARGWAVDVRDFDAQQQVFAEIAEHFGAVDLVIAAAGVLGPLQTIGPTDPTDWDRVIDINLNGV
jgi:NAD(P)-dependent dehydrogenase (short-subunit alcohol dehydrogenase family)